MGPIRLEWGGPIPVRCTPPFCAECGALKRRGGGRAPTRTSRQWRFVLRQATFGQLYTKGCRICASYRRRRYQGGLRGGNHQHRNEFLFSPPENPRVKQNTRTLSHLARALIYIVLSTLLILGASPHLEGGTSVAS